jgi:hypothetical protein
MTRFEFAFDTTYQLLGRAVGVSPASSWVAVDGDRFEARFGPWRVRTELSNVSAAEVTGPYSVLKTIGPAHLSARDRGLTFATNPRRGVCILFDEPVRGIDPVGAIRHPGLTVTVADPEGLVAALTGPVRATAEQPDEALEQAAEDELHTMTASELRALADDRGLRHTSSMRKAELVELLEAQLDPELVEELAHTD